MDFWKNFKTLRIGTMSAIKKPAIPLNCRIGGLHMSVVCHSDAMSTASVRMRIRTITAYFFAALGLIAMIGLMGAHPAHAVASEGSGGVTPTCKRGPHPPGTCGANYQLIGQYGSAQGCDAAGRAIVKTNMHGRGDKYGRDYFTWACFPLKGAAKGWYNLAVYWWQS